jgi:hypothetical protein
MLCARLASCESLTVPRLQIVPREQKFAMTTRTHLSALALSQLKRTRYIDVLFTGYDVVDVKGGERA